MYHNLATRDLAFIQLPLLSTDVSVCICVCVYPYVSCTVTEIPILSVKFGKSAFVTCRGMYFKKKASAKASLYHQHCFWNQKFCRVLACLIVHLPFKIILPSLLVRAWLKVWIDLGELTRWIMLSEVQSFQGTNLRYTPLDTGLTQEDEENLVKISIYREANVLICADKVLSVWHIWPHLFPTFSK